MKEILSLFRDVLSPENDWGSFFRKIIGVTIAGITAIVGFNVYLNRVDLRDKGEKPVQVILDQSKDKHKTVRKLIEMILRLDPSIKSVWVYGWPDALSLVPIMYVGESENPIPASVFDSRDANSLGHFLFGDCVELPREFPNLTCPINGFEDSWGVVVVSFRGEPDRHTISEIEGLAHRVGLILYTNSQHSGQID